MAKATSPGLPLLRITYQYGLCKSWTTICTCYNSQAASQHVAGDPTIQNSNNTQQSQQEPEVPEVFKTPKAGKAKIEEGSSGEGNKPFCFRCYKTGHGKLECKEKLFCDICGSTEHLTRRCPILKQPRLLAHPCGYDVNGLGFYHIPHAPINIGKTSNTTALVTVQGGVLSIQQLITELGRLIPERDSGRSRNMSIIPLLFHFHHGETCWAQMHLKRHI
jgi:hypothetical protein